MLSFDAMSYLYNLNPWWTYPSYTIPECAYPRRNAFAVIRNQLSLNLLISITGLRRTGKTTILKQLIADLLSTSEIASKSVMFFSFDQLLVNRNADLLTEIIDIYLERVVGKKIWELDSTVYIFLDEVQYVTDWQTVLKRYYDQTKKIKFLISGSASLQVREKAKESLAGRILTTDIGVLNFREYLRLRNSGIEIPAFSLEQCEVKGIAEIQASYSGKINGLFEDFLIRGQFPEVVTMGMSDEQAKQYIIDSVLMKILEIDIPTYFEVKRSEEIKNIFRIAAVETGNMVEFGTIARDVGISRNTVASYYLCMEKAFLMNLLYNFTRSARKQLRTMKKCYVASTNFSAMVSGMLPSISISSEVLGHYAETYAHNVLRGQFPALHFIRHREKEIDFIVPASGGNMLMEVKYSQRIDKHVIKNLLHFMNYFHVRQGIILTKDSVSRADYNQGELCNIPVWAL